MSQPAARRGLFARKRFGQHFLERAWVDKIVHAIAPSGGEVFLEVGPGLGALTRPLAAASRCVIAFEIDGRLADSLRQAAMPGLVVVHTDFLDVSSTRLADVLKESGFASDTPLRVAGNLPYNVGSPILFALLGLFRDGIALSDATVMLQREVAERLVAPPGSRDYGVLSVLVRHAARVERLLLLPPGAFRPAPKVDSAVVRLQFHPDNPPARNRQAFGDLVRAVFTRRRKTLANAMEAYPGALKPAIRAALRDAGIDGSRRPETLDIPEFVRLSDAIGVL